MYAVFDVTREVAEIKAVKLIKEGKGSLKEFKEDLDGHIDKIYKTMRPVRLSNIYSNYKQAWEYSLLVEFGGRDLQIKRRVESNKISKKTGETLLKWVVA